MILSTTPFLENYTITEYLGIVTGIYENPIYGGSLGDFSAALFHSSYGASTSSAGKKGALEWLEGEAKRLGADAVVGIQFQFTSYSSRSFIIIATGTAVKIKEKEVKKETVTPKKSIIEHTSFEDSKIDTIMMELEALSGAIPINKRVKELHQDNEGFFSEELLKRLDHCAYLEKMYGNKKTAALNLIKESFSSSEKTKQGDH